MASHTHLYPLIQSSHSSWSALCEREVWPRHPLSNLNNRNNFLLFLEWRPGLYQAMCHHNPPFCRHCLCSKYTSVPNNQLCFLSRHRLSHLPVSLWNTLPGSLWPGRLLLGCHITTQSLLPA
uniref:Uncharacterized protein n=1 Tax=Pipistrellus kuhlii TaxID=59472 RepID=A0A7J7ZJM6_PIPKU|nr:hypothetical protein mPipKuh1_009563 [Pipistrellus kuhlii]